MRALSLESLEYVANGKGGGGSSRRNFSSNKPSTSRMCIIMFKVTFQEVSVIEMFVTDIREGWKSRNILGKAAATALNTLQLTF